MINTKQYRLSIRNIFSSKALMISALLVIINAGWLFGYGVFSFISMAVLVILALRSKLIDNYTSSTLLSVSILISFFCFIGGLSWLFSIRLTPLIIFTVISLFELITIYALDFESMKFTKIRLFNINFLIIFFLFLFSFSGVAIKHSTAYNIDLLVFGGDNLSHIEHTLVTEENQGYLYGAPEDIQDKLTSSHAGYPEGLHLNYSLIKRSLSKIINFLKFSNTILFFTIAFTSLFLLLCLSIYSVGRELLNDEALSLIFYFVLILAILIGPGLNLFLYGFQVQMCALFLMMCQILLLSRAMKSQNTGDRLVLSAVALFLNIGISFSWLFAMPMALLGSTVSILFIFKDQFMNLIKKRKINKTMLLLTVSITLSTLFSLVQLYVQHLYNRKVDSVNEIGWVQHINFGIAFSAISILLSLILIIKLKNKKYIALVIYGLSSMLFTLAIGIYQCSKVHELRYYFYKAGFFTMAIGLTIVFSFIARLGRYLFYNYKLNILTLPIILALIISVVLQYRSDNLRTFVLGRVNNGSPSLAVRTEQIMAEGKTPLIVGSCNRVSDFTMTRLSLIVNRKNYALNQSINFSQLTASGDEFIKLVADNIPKKEYTILAGGDDSYVYFKDSINSVNDKSNLPSKLDCPSSMY